MHWQILDKCNHRILSVETLSVIIDFDNCNQSTALAECIEELKAEGLIYCNFDKTEIVTIINTDLVKIEN